MWREESTQGKGKIRATKSNLLETCKEIFYDRFLYPQEKSPNPIPPQLTFSKIGQYLSHHPSHLPFWWGRVGGYMGFLKPSHTYLIMIQKRFQDVGKNPSQVFAWRVCVYVLISSCKGEDESSPPQPPTPPTPPKKANWSLKQIFGGVDRKGV